MKPIEFITTAAANDYNTPAGEIEAAIKKASFRIHSANASWEVLSYYYDHQLKQMVLDIQPISTTD